MPLPPTEVAEINRWLAHARPYEQLVDHDDTLALKTRPPQNAVDHALHLIAQDAAAVLDERLRQHRQGPTTSRPRSD